MERLIEIKESIQSNKRFGRGQSMLINFSDIEWLVEQIETYEHYLRGIGQNEDDKGNHLRANRALGIINMNGRGTRKMF